MVKVAVEYLNDLRCRATHLPSGSSIETDAPVDNHGQGRRFSPTDLVAAALATCIATVLGIAAKHRGWDLTGMRVEVEKKMSASGDRRISGLETHVWMPLDLPPAERQQAQRIAHTCPVHRSLHPDIAAAIHLHWPGEG